MSVRSPRAAALAVFLAQGLLAAPAALAQYSSPIRDVENPARTAFQANGTINVQAGFAGVLNSPLHTIPAGRRAVVEFVSVRCASPSGNPIVYADVRTTEATGGGTTTRAFQIPLQFQGADPFSGPTWVGALSTRLYSDPGFGGGASISGGVIRANGTGTGFCTFSFSGHTIAF